MFQIWVLGMSLVAVLNESIPHMYVYVYPDRKVPVSHPRGLESPLSLPTYPRQHGAASRYTTPMSSTLISRG